MRHLLIAAVAAATCAALARDITWTGAASTTWDASAKNWTTDGSDAVAFAAGDNATVTNGSAITFGANVSPGTATFDVAGDLTLASTSYGFANATGALVKRGAGTLSLTGAKNRNRCGWLVYEGALKANTANALYTFGELGQPFSIHVYDGGTLWTQERNSTGWGLDGSHETNVKGCLVLHPGGTLRADAHVTFRTLTIDGGTVVQGAAGMKDFGFLKVIERLTVTNAVQTFDYPSGYSNKHWPFVCLGANVSTVFDVDDASGDEGADLVFRTPLIRYNAWSGIGWRKAGKGTMLYAPSKYVDNRELTATAIFDGDIHVDEGTLDIGEQEAVSPAFDRTIYVHSNATLRISRRNALNDENGVAGDIKTKLVVQGGTLSLSDATSQMAHVSLGSLTLDDATFDYSGLGGFSGGNLGLMTFKALALKGSSAYVFDPANGYPGRMYWSHVHLWDEPLTVIDVADITGDAEADFVMRHRLTDRCTHAAIAAEPWGTFVSGGFVKTGPGTMCVDTNTCAFTGDVEVRQGTLRLGLDGTKNGDPGNTAVRWSLLGDMGTNRTVTVWTNATLDVAQRNAFGNINVYTNDEVKATFAVRGGTLRLCPGYAVRLPPVWFDDGELDCGGTGSAFGHGMFAGTVKLTGTQPYDWQPSAGGRYQWLCLNGLPQTAFDVADITGDAAADFTLGLPLAIPHNALSGSTVLNGWKFGFVKTGAGTMRYAAPGSAVYGSVDHAFNGDVAVSNGTLVVDGGMERSGVIRVSAGAYLGGTGTVKGGTLAVTETIQPGGRKTVGTLTVDGTLLTSGTLVI
ncbi:MAG: hypothetical protein IJ658_02165, partial [Kiritimatiellae bacterium]|nr:hypothetical protein [Kiritimatiellia bacterium]